MYVEYIAIERKVAQYVDYDDSENPFFHELKQTEIFRHKKQTINLYK